MLNKFNDDMENNNVKKMFLDKNIEEKINLKDINNLINDIIND